MNSLLLSFVLGVLVIVCFILKMKGQHLSRSLDNAICIVIPIACLLIFIIIIIKYG